MADNPFSVANISEVAKPILTALAGVEQQKAVAEVQARMMIARANPRDSVRCVDMILQDCTRVTLAETALYAYSRGGSDISGPSIRLMENIARRWGNIASGIKEIARHQGYSECVAYAWDLESGYYDERQFTVRHWRDTKKGGYATTDERDIYETVANMGQRRKRAVLQTVIPGDVTEAAVEQCEETLHAKADTSPEGLQKMLAAFVEFGVTKEQIEARCQRRFESIRPAQVVMLRRIYMSLRDEMSEPNDWFDRNEVTQDGEKEAPTPGKAAGNAALRNHLRNREKKSNNGDDSPQANAAAPEAPPDTAQADATGQTEHPEARQSATPTERSNVPGAVSPNTPSDAAPRDHNAGHGIDGRWESIP